MLHSVRRIMYLSLISLKKFSQNRLSFFFPFFSLYDVMFPQALVSDGFDDDDLRYMVS